MSSEQYASSEGDANETESDCEDRLDSRQVVASVSLAVQRRHSEDARITRKAVIQFSDGCVWEASPIASGGYEFVMQDSAGNLTVAKWLSRSSKLRRQSYHGSRHSSDFSSEPEERRFQFSIFDKNTKKRPVLAWLNRQSIEILDRHSGRTLPSTANSITSSPTSVFDEVSPDNGPLPMLEVSEKLKLFIVVTGTWVALREGFTNGNRLEESQFSSPKFSNSPSFRTKPKPATVSSISNSPPADSTGNTRPSLQGTLPIYNSTDHNGIKTAGGDIPQRSFSLGRKSLTRQPQGNTSNLHQVVPETSRHNEFLTPRLTDQPISPLRRQRPISFQAPMRNPPSPEASCKTQTLAEQPKPLEPPLPSNSPARIFISTNSKRYSVPSEPSRRPRERRRFGFKAMLGSLFKRSST